MIKPRIIFNKINPYIDSPEAIIITGMRRTGKTTVLNYYFDKIGQPNKIFLDLENPNHRKYFEEENYDRIKSNLMNLGLDFTKKTYIFLDEIQFVRQLPSVVKYFIDHDQVKFFLTGSASFYMKNLFTETLAGRKYIFELYPLTFSEYLIFKGSVLKLPRVGGKLNAGVYETMANLYEEYILYGGFPGAVLKESASEKKKSLEDIFTSFFQLEVMQLGDFRRNNVVRDLMLLLLQRVGQKVDFQKLSRELGISRPTLYDYLAFLEGTYFIQLVRPFSRGKDVEIRKMPKIFACDTGMINALVKADPGSVFENAVYLALRQEGEVHYYQRKNGAELDFILNKNAGYEVKMKPDRTDLVRLSNVAKELNLEKFKVVSWNYSDLDGIIYGFQIPMI